MGLLFYGKTHVYHEQDMKFDPQYHERERERREKGEGGEEMKGTGGEIWMQRKGGETKD